MNRAFRVWLFLLLALRMRLVAMLVGGLRMLLGTIGVLLALGVVALAVLFGCGTMCLGGVFVVFGSLVVFISGHGILVGCQPSAGIKLAVFENVPAKFVRAIAMRGKQTPPPLQNAEHVLPAGNLAYLTPFIVNGYLQIGMGSGVVFICNRFSSR